MFKRGDNKNVSNSGLFLRVSIREMSIIGDVGVCLIWILYLGSVNYRMCLLQCVSDIGVIYYWGVYERGSLL